MECQCDRASRMRRNHRCGREDGAVNRLHRSWRDHTDTVAHAQLIHRRHLAELFASEVDDRPRRTVTVKTVKSAFDVFGASATSMPLVGPVDPASVGAFAEGGFICVAIPVVCLGDFGTRGEPVGRHRAPCVTAPGSPCLASS